MSARIFLDFDGVLRRNTSPTSRLDEDCVRLFEQTVLAHRDTVVVIASTWRLVHSLPAIRRLFSPAFASRIEGVTPDVPEAEEYVREEEIKAYLAKVATRGWRWIAVDDDPDLYRPASPLVRIDPARGFSTESAALLVGWLR